MAADDTGFIDLRFGEPRRRRSRDAPARHRPAAEAATHGSCDGRGAPGRWIVGLDAERALRDLGMRGDIIKTMHRAFTERGQDRGIADYVVDTRHGVVAGVSSTPGCMMN
jgi:hypothetical protein